MGNKLQTIYEYFNNYSEKMIDDMISNLSNDDRQLLQKRYGDDLHNPKSSDKWNQKYSEKFYGTLVPKIKKLLEKEAENVQNSNELPKLETIQVGSNIEGIDYQKQLMQLLKEGKNNNELCDILNINSQKLYQELLKLKYKGLQYSKKYYSDGSIKYGYISTFQDLKKIKNVGLGKTIITEDNENNLRILLISDLHFGNELERIDLINRAYNYCIKNGINIILCGGDLIDGSYSKGNQRITNLYQQLEYFITNYPYDKNILTFSVAGDHDMSALSKASLDIIEACNNYRHDIIIGGYNNTEINLKNDKIHLYHHIEAGTMRQMDAPIILHGHSHKYLTEIRNNTLNITIPSLSNIGNLMPSALELNIRFTKGYISNAVIKHLYFGKQDVVLSESSFDISTERKVNNEPIQNIESFRNQYARSSTDDASSQIERFYKRYDETTCFKNIKK